MICVKLDCVPGLSHDLKTIVRRWLQLNKSKGVHIIPRRFGDNKNVKCTVVSKKVFIGDVLAALTAGTCMLFPNTLIMLPSLRSACVPLDLSQYIFFFSIVDPVFHAGVKGVGERSKLSPCYYYYLDPTCNKYCDLISSSVGVAQGGSASTSRC